MYYSPGDPLLIKDKVQCGVTQSLGIKQESRVFVVLALASWVNLGHGVQLLWVMVS